ncbi:phosphatidylglycerophosphatase A [Desulfovibrio sp. OttesenSCG-928-G15]|nr:phosphatidylglycerophosphatase A [Desulfovibrio sp. OttesenSCG-928-G15]
MPVPFSLHFARVWLAGTSPKAPGTCGSFVALLLAPLVFMPLPIPLRVLLLVALLAAGTWACGEAEKLLGKKDPSEVVIDEVFGQWLTLLPFASLGLWGYLAAFALFRLFDITKPWPVRQLEDIGGGFGIMIDDGAAGLYAMACLGLLLAFFG